MLKPDAAGHGAGKTRSAPPTPGPNANVHRSESALMAAGYDVLSYDAKDRDDAYPFEDEGRGARRGSGQAGPSIPSRSPAINQFEGAFAPEQGGQEAYHRLEPLRRDLEGDQGEVQSGKEPLRHQFETAGPDVYARPARVASNSWFHGIPAR